MKVFIIILLFSSVSLGSDCIPDGTGFKDVLEYKGLSAPNPKAIAKIFKKQIDKMSAFRKKNCAASASATFDNCKSKCQSISIREMGGSDYRPICHRACVLQRVLIEKHKAEIALYECDLQVRELSSPDSKADTDNEKEANK